MVLIHLETESESCEFSQDTKNPNFFLPTIKVVNYDFPYYVFVIINKCIHGIPWLF